MGFWSGFEGLTGHRPGAFKGFSLKDIIDKDMWDRLPRTWSGKMGTPAHLKANPMDRQLTRGGEPMMTNWYKGGGMLAEPTTGEAAHTQHAMANRPVRPVHYPNMGATYPAMPAQAQTRPLAPKPNLNPQPVPGFYPYSGRTHGGGMVDPNWSSATAVNRPPTMANKKTVKKIFADPTKSNEIIETIEEKVPTGSAQWGNVQHPPNWQQRFDRPSIMNMFNMQSWQDVARRKWEERMKARRGY